MKVPIANLADFAALDPFFRIIEQGLDGLAGPANQDRGNGEQLSMEESDGAVIAGSVETPGAFGVIFDRDRWRRCSGATGATKPSTWKGTGGTLPSV